MPEKVPFYTNSSQLPVGHTDDLIEALNLQEPLQTKFSGGCIEAGNLVQTDKGLLKIECICKNFKELSPIRALSYNKKKEISEWDLIIDAMRIGVKIKDRIRIKAERGLDITTSSWHPFFVLDDGEVIEKRADELKINDYLLQNSTEMLVSEDDVTITKDKAYMLGYFVGNGSLSRFIDNRGGNKLEKHLVRFHSGRKGPLKAILNILNTNFQTKLTSIQKDKRGECFCIGTSNEAVVSYLFKCGFNYGKKVDIVKIPQIVKNNIYDFGDEFLSGLIDSDGYIDKWGNMEYSTVSPYLAHDIKEIFNLMGVQFSCIKKESVRENERPIFRITISSHQMTDRKDRLCLEDGFKSSRIKELRSDRLSRHLPVIRVKETSRDVGTKDFYDLTTKNNHNYLAGNKTFVFIHNTVFHCFLGEKIRAAEAKLLVKNTFSKYEMPYFSVTPTFSTCKKHGYMNGEHYECTTEGCKEECLVYSRVVGYISPTVLWNKGKKKEYKMRKVFKA